jgi:hypothetical protein
VGFVARLRYQQTKIDGAADTILVDQEIVAIIRTQQEWMRRARTDRETAAGAPKYLFVAARKNRNGDRPYSDRRLRERVGELARRLNIRDSTGALVDFQRTHRFRHTKATTLLNAGVPLHVVQRYLGHLTPAMTMTRHGRGARGPKSGRRDQGEAHLAVLDREVTFRAELVLFTAVGWWPISALSSGGRVASGAAGNMSLEIQEFHDRSGVLNGSERVQQGVR